IGMALLGLVVFGWVSFSTLQTVEINGPLYKQIRSTVDLDGDIAPAAINLQGLRLAIYRALAEPDPGKRAERIDEMRKAEKAYNSMYDEDMKGLPDGPVKKALAVAPHETALEYFRNVDESLIPLLEKGEIKRADDFRKDVLLPLAR